MNKILLSILIITAIEFNLSWNGFENMPNQAKAWDEQGNEIQLVSQWEKTDGIYYWNARTADNGYNWFLNFWQEI